MEGKEGRKGGRERRKQNKTRKDRILLDNRGKVLQDLMERKTVKNRSKEVPVIKETTAKFDYIKIKN